MKAGKKITKNQIREIIADTSYWQPEMIIEEKPPFFWRLSKMWIDEKTNEIYKLLATPKKGSKKGKYE